MRAERTPGLRRLMPAAQRVRQNVVLFNSWWGRLADSPKAIAEELRRRDLPLEHVWVLEDPAAAPEGAIGVRPGSREYLRQCGRARFIVSNNTLPGYFRKKRGTTYLQTWHGTPFKRIGFDIERPAFPDSERYLRNLQREVAAWDYLVSPNSFSTGVLRRAFGYEGTIIETGYPRNDALLAPSARAGRARVRAELGLADGDCAVLYAPTWRDGAEFSSALDLPALGDTLGEGYVVLLRAHSAVASTAVVENTPRLRNVSSRDDVTDLLLAADVLVTDYSSVMFDFALTGKPMLFFAYDLAHYRDELRGLYLDFTDEAPGPMVTTADELIAALRGLDAQGERYAVAYESFRKRFCALEDGCASVRVVDTVFGDAG